MMNKNNLIFNNRNIFIKKNNSIINKLLLNN